MAKASYTPPQATSKSLGFSVTPRAAARINKLAHTESSAAVMLRVTVSGGGCQGFQYNFSFDADLQSDDIVFETNGAKVIIDTVSLSILEGGVLDYIDDLVGSYFSVENPNAASSCGCGTSFSIA